MDGEIEIARFFHEAPAETCGKLLGDAGIPFRRSTDAPTSDITALGRASNAAILIMVPQRREVEARSVLLDQARREVANGVDASHPMIAWGNADLESVLKEASEWSAFDVAVAEKLLQDRGVKAEPEKSKAVPESTRVESSSQYHSAASSEPLPGDRSANPWVVAFGFLMATMGSLGAFMFSIPGTLLAMIIAWDSMFSTQVNTSGERRYVHHQRARMIGVALFVYALLIFCVAMGIRLTVGLSLDR